MGSSYNGIFRSFLFLVICILEIMTPHSSVGLIGHHVDPDV